MLEEILRRDALLRECVDRMLAAGVPLPAELAEWWRQALAAPRAAPDAEPRAKACHAAQTRRFRNWLDGRDGLG